MRMSQSLEVYQLLLFREHYRMRNKSEWRKFSKSWMDMIVMWKSLLDDFPRKVQQRWKLTQKGGICDQPDSGIDNNQVMSGSDLVRLCPFCIQTRRLPIRRMLWTYSDPRLLQCKIAFWNIYSLFRKRRWTWIRLFGHVTW
jgi:hypothetical protein